MRKTLLIKILLFISLYANGIQGIVITPIVPSLISNDHTSEGFMVTISSGRIIHFFRLDPGSGGSHTGNNGKVVQRHTDDGGITWSSIDTVYSDQYDDRNINGGILQNGRIVLTFRRILVYNSSTNTHIDFNLIYSDDDGVTWSPRQVINSTGITSDNSTIQYVPTKGYMNQYNTTNYVELRFSNDGVNWGNPSYIWDYRTSLQYIINESCFAYTKNGKMVGLMRNDIHSFGHNYYQVSSNDYGNTWTQPIHTNMANGYFCPSPTIFYDQAHDDIWAIATDRRGDDTIYSHNLEKIWIYVSKVDSILNNPTKWTLVDTFSRPHPTNYKFYGYPCVTRKHDGNYLIVFTESDAGSHELANLYQFEIKYDSSMQAYDNHKFLVRKLSQNYPNPASSQTAIDYYVSNLQENKLIKINFYNELGNLVYCYTEPYPAQGKNTFIVNTSNLTNGIYFYSFENARLNEKKKMIVLK
jgi:hypothetical protein